MLEKMLRRAIEQVPAGRWGVGVSGGADSVALLFLIQQRRDIEPHIAHLDHETRNGESTRDADFVRVLADEFQTPITLSTRTAIEASFTKISNNLSNRFRGARFAFFGQVIRANKLDGMLLAHHADDQAETVLLRLLRGARVENLRAMQLKSRISGINVCRPLLSVRHSEIVQYLTQLDQPWREDESNNSDQYHRNRLRHWLINHPHMHEPLLELAKQSRVLKNWIEDAAPVLPESFPVTLLRQLCNPLAKASAHRWLIDFYGADSDQDYSQKLIDMASDAATPPRQQLGRAKFICRRKGQISCQQQP